MNTKQQTIAELINFGRNVGSAAFNFEAVFKIAKLARKHQKMQEMNCNGYGWMGGTFYTTGLVLEAALIKKVSAYIADDVTVFDVEAARLEKVIVRLAGSEFAAEFQGDPRGATVRLTYNGRRVPLELF